jgi:riboflavin biosynthesis pyrimidine reductase
VAFRALRSAADVILAGAATVRAEDYGPAVVRADLQAARVARGQAARPRIAVVSASLDLDPTARLFGTADADTGTDGRPIVVTDGASDPERRRRLARVAEVVVAGADRLDWLEALTGLRARTGAGVVLVEGGPSVNGQLLSADLVDEVCLSLAPMLVGGPSPRVAHGPPPAAMCEMTLAHAVHGDGFLLLRYLAARHAGPPTMPTASSE